MRVWAPVSLHVVPLVPVSCGMVDARNGPENETTPRFGRSRGALLRCVGARLRYEYQNRRDGRGAVAHDMLARHSATRSKPAVADNPIAPLLLTRPGGPMRSPSCLGWSHARDVRPSHMGLPRAHGAGRQEGDGAELGRKWDGTERNGQAGQRRGVAMPPPRRAGSAVARIRASTRSVTGVASGWTPPLPSTAAARLGRGPSAPACPGVTELRGSRCGRSFRSTTMVSPSSTSAIGPPRKASGADVPDDQADRSARGSAASVIRAMVMLPLAAERRNARGRVEQLWHPRSAAGAFVPDHHHVVVLEAVRTVFERLHEGTFAVEHAGSPREHAVLDPAFDAGDFEDRPALGGEVAAQKAESAGVLEGLVDRVDHVLVGSRRVESPHPLGQRLAGCRSGASPSRKPASSSSLTMT